VRLIPRDEGFFEMFAEIAGCLTGAATRLAQMFGDPSRLSELVKEIKELEKKADNLTHGVSVRIDSSFVTPLDREDIHLLATRLDNVVDLIDGTARRAVMFHIRESRQPARQMADVLCRSTEIIGRMIADMKKPRNVAENTLAMKQLEEEGDAIYFEAIGGLFDGDRTEPLEVIKWKEIYDHIEHTIDECEHVALVLESIAIKNS
jgi:predicted phosphate transport protein (TIGR00153 family)